jgi:hypothetical protein
VEFVPTESHSTASRQGRRRDERVCRARRAGDLLCNYPGVRNLRSPSAMRVRTPEGQGVYGLRAGWAVSAGSPFHQPAPVATRS